MRLCTIGCNKFFTEKQQNKTAFGNVSPDPFEAWLGMPAFATNTYVLLLHSY